MFQLYRILHIVGLAMFFGSILAHVAATLIPSADDNAAAMLAVRESIVLANWFVTVPGLALAVVSGGVMAATNSYRKTIALPLHILAAVSIVAIAVTVLLPAAVELESAARALRDGVATTDAAVVEMRERIFGAINIGLAVVAILLGAALPHHRKV